ncbi:hypothetical protein Tco_0637401 [Tanacetum coccineum]
MVACLEKSEGNANFHEIVDFLTGSSVHYALTVKMIEKREKLVSYGFVATRVPNKQNQDKVEKSPEQTSKGTWANIITYTPEPSETFHFTCDEDDDDQQGNEELSTIPEKESDKFIKSSVEDLIPIPSESEDSSESDSENVLPSCQYFSPVRRPEDNVKIYSNPLFEFDDGYISSDVNPLFDEVLEDIECKVSYDSNLNESTFLVTPLSDSNEDGCLAPGDDIKLLLYYILYILL